MSEVEKIMNSVDLTPEEFMSAIINSKVSVVLIFEDSTVFGAAVRGFKRGQIERALLDVLYLNNRHDLSKGTTQTMKPKDVTVN